MTFLNSIMLFGLFAVAVPVIIHLLNRTKSTTVYWGAMQFLVASMTTRRRRVVVEEILLLVLRCLIVLAVPLALARPFLQGGLVPFAGLVVTLVAGVLLLVGGTVAWTHSKAWKWSLAAGIALVALIVVTLYSWRKSEGNWFGGGVNQDIAVIIDGSASMELSNDGRGNFDRALDSARIIISSAKKGDAVSLVVGAASPVVLVGKPTSDRRELEAALSDKACRLSGGIMSVPETVKAALETLQAGQNPARKIVIITDCQGYGWFAKSDQRWRLAVEKMRKRLPAPEVICLRLPIPKTFRNVTVEDITPSRSVIGTDRPVRIDVKISNNGSLPVKPLQIGLFIDDLQVGRETPSRDIVPGSADMVSFVCKFDSPGRHRLQAKAFCEDNLGSDNQLEKVLDIQASLPVLVVDGDPARAERLNATGLAALALNPAGTASGTEAGRGLFLVEPHVVSFPDLISIRDFDRYRAVILSDVSRLPAVVADRLATYVRGGGGLLVAAGGRTESAFYNDWRTSSGEMFMPAQLTGRKTGKDPGFHFQVKSMLHPALKLVAESEGSDIDSALVNMYWQTQVDANDSKVRTGGLLDSGDPWLIERQCGRGYVVLAATSFESTDSNLSSRRIFVPLLHELVYYLSASAPEGENIRSGTEFALELRDGRNGMTLNDRMVDDMRNGKVFPVEVLTPSNVRKPAQAGMSGACFAISYADTVEPGLYRLILPAGLVSAGSNKVHELPFAVLRQPEEAVMTELAEPDYLLLKKRMQLKVADTVEEAVSVMGASLPGRELWKFIVAAALLGLVAEVLLMRWIAVRRGRHESVQPVFGKVQDETAAAQSRAAAGGWHKEVKQR